ncbi:hypothetical protein Sjap_005107 [Stephania japonica]|uniref:Integrase catalytic domain-containing protein n=1 Tax=Stephania japonica TaxID=461633 RepID=A0AAP0K4S2_9MAGN
MVMVDFLRPTNVYQLSYIRWADVKSFVKACDACQRNKYETMAPGGLLQPLPILVIVWNDISMDFLEGLPASRGFNSILVVVDRLSKYAHFLPLKHLFPTNTVAGLFIKGVMKLHGFPMSIVSDRDKVFLNHLWWELFCLQHTHLNRNTTYHPQSVRQTEVVNHCLETYLRCFISQRLKEWSDWLHWAEYWYNTSFHTYLNCSPFKVVYGRDPSNLLRHGLSSLSSPSDLDTMLQSRDHVLQELRDQFLAALNRMKQRADPYRREVIFEMDELGFLKLRPYRQFSLASGPIRVEPSLRWSI